MEKRLCYFVSSNNFLSFEESLNDMSKEVLKLRLLHDYISNFGNTTQSSFLFSECVSCLEQYLQGFELFYCCVNDGKEINAD